MDHMADIRITFFQECEEQLGALEAGLLTMEEGDASSETVNAVFRAVHSIKGGAGAFKLTALVEFAHVFETVLDQVRGGALVPDSDVMKIMLRAADVLADLVADARDGRETAPSSHGSVSGELEALLHASGGVYGQSNCDIPTDFAPVLVSFDDLGAPPAHRFEISFRPHAALYAKANEPLALLREVRNLGEAVVQCDVSGLPDFDLFDPAQSYLSWTVGLSTAQPEQAIRDIFEFVEGDCDLAITQAAGETEAALDEIVPIPVDQSPAEELAAVALSDQLIPSVVPRAETRQSDRTSVIQPTIRVDLDRVDRLINLVGELVINQAMLSQRVSQSAHGRDSHVATSLDELEHLTRNLQESVMAIRAQPVKPLFQRMSRIVREVAEATSKEVRLRTEGEQTEVDKTVLELLADPLTHMIRNAVDHGIERPEARLAAGKLAEGTVKLTAAHRSGRVVIEISDDGAGLNRPRILESAIRKGLVAPDAVLNDAEIDNLLFLPGFSTATTISSISGRGVGMDVVKRSIQALGGRITTSSKLHEGSTFSMSLPLTLAVLDGIVVSIDSQTFVIPLTVIVETLKLAPDWIHAMGEGTHVIHVRGQFVPLIDVGHELGVRLPSDPRNGGVAILVETEKGSRSALLVDGIQDQRQVVIKSLETNYDQVTGVAAATILGDGRVAMILDVDGLVGGRGPDAVIVDQAPEQAMNYARAS